MNTAVAARPQLDWAGRALLDGAAARAGAVVREALQRGVWNPALRLWCRPLAVDGSPPAAPSVYVANHASHADTVLLRLAVGATVRRRLAVGAADDYFFSTPRRGAAFTLAVGAFPFPRRGDVGLRRAEDLLRDGWSVLLYPQGTRNPDGEYRPGVLRLAGHGWPLVPVGIAGTSRVLPKGARVPRRSPAAVVFGAPLRPRRLQMPDAMDVLVGGIEGAARRARKLAAACGE